MRQLIFISLFLACISIQAQEFSDPALKKLVDAELAFIKMAKDENTRDAFLIFLADSAVTFVRLREKEKNILNPSHPMRRCFNGNPFTRI